RGGRSNAQRLVQLIFADESIQEQRLEASALRAVEGPAEDGVGAGGVKQLGGLGGAERRDQVVVQRCFCPVRPQDIAPERVVQGALVAQQRREGVHRRDVVVLG